MKSAQKQAKTNSQSIQLAKVVSVTAAVGIAALTMVYAALPEQLYQPNDDSLKRLVIYSLAGLAVIVLLTFASRLERQVSLLTKHEALLIAKVVGVVLVMSVVGLVLILSFIHLGVE